MNARKLVMISDPLGDMTGGRSNGPVDLKAIEAEMRSFDLCGRSWADLPQDTAELLFNTFKPMFCSGREGAVSLNHLACNIDWLAYDRGVFVDVLSDHHAEIRNVCEIGMPSLLIVCSEKACKALLGKGMAQLFAYHIRRDDRAGEKAGLFLGEIRLPSRSPLFALFKSDPRDVEVVCIPRPICKGQWPIGIKAKGMPVERMEEMRVDYVRRVHRELGCEKHSMW